ncbi:MAG TPA: MFS transporter, partial [Nitrososphaerales archaeon]|nr:MFS transporter [Nitrososphaerales archaeon]
LVFARVVYAVNWMNFAAIFYLMESDLRTDVSGLGALTAAFYLGIGIAQVPGGVLAAKYGPKKVVNVGIFLASLAALGTAAASTVPQMAVLRFLVGTGMAFVFAPGVVIVSKLIRGGKSGIGVGLFNSAFDLGGLIALFGWVLLAAAIGWRPSLALSGGVGVLTGALVVLYAPRDEVDDEFRVSGGALKTILGDRQLILLGLGTLGFGIANTIVSGFMVFYVVKSLGYSGTVGGSVASLVTVVPIFTALWGGRFYDRISKHRQIMILALLGSAASLAIGFVPSILAAAACSALGGVVAGIGYTFAFAGARDLNRAGPVYDTLAIAWVNSISLTGSFVPPVFFSYVVQAAGYAQGWLWSGALTLLFLLPVMLMVETWRQARAA